jgi:perosamine synthetase
MNAERIHYTKPSITARETSYVAEAAEHGWGERCYDFIYRFEKEFAAHIGTKHALATSSATGAIHLGLAAHGIGEGDEVIIGDINWIASVAPITYVGASPVIVDVLRNSWCVDPRAVEAAITSRTRAIMAVHLYGNLCNLDALEEIARKHNLILIEDAAEAIGSKWHGKRAGSVGNFGTFSFHGTKTITTGEGGMFVTNDTSIFEKAVTLANHGRARGETRQFWPERIGYKYKMSNLQAAIGCAQLERVDELIRGKRRVFEFYAQALADLPVTMNPEPAGTTNGYWMPTVVVDEGQPFDRDALLRSFADANIDGRVFFWPLSSLGIIDGARPQAVAHAVAPRAFNLPSYHDMTDEHLKRVVDVVRHAILR